MLFVLAKETEATSFTAVGLVVCKAMFVSDLMKPKLVFTNPKHNRKIKLIF